VSKRLMSIVTILVVIGVALVALAWFDGGQEEQRLIVEPVELQGMGE
jgi:hypothetical protein